MASSLTVTQRASFCFSNLPAEIRNRIYYYALSNAIIPSHNIRYEVPRQCDSNPKLEWPFIGLLLTSKTIHNEASYILQKHGHLHEYVRFIELRGREVPFQVKGRYERHLEFIQNLHVTISWSRLHEIRSDYVNYRYVFPSRGTQALCEAIGNLDQLKTLTIIWVYIGPLPSEKEKSPRGDEILHHLLQPLVRLQAKLPKLRIEVEMTGINRPGGPRRLYAINMRRTDLMTVYLAMGLLVQENFRLVKDTWFLIDEVGHINRPAPNTPPRTSLNEHHNTCSENPTVAGYSPKIIRTIPSVNHQQCPHHQDPTPSLNKLQIRDQITQPRFHQSDLNRVAHPFSRP